MSENLFERGERLTAQKLNKFVARRPTMSGAGRINSSGSDDSIEIDLTEVIHVRVTESNTTYKPVRYGWIQVYREDGANLTANKTWNNITTRTANATDDYAIELNDGSITVGDDQVYRAERSLTTGEWLISKGGGSAGQTTVTNPIIMLLGPWADYKDCPGVPAKPPTFTANGTDFCAPPYAWAAYDVCNYKYVKKFDMRDFGHWATELNGGSATAYRRFYNAYYGNSTESANFTANTPTSCKGVRFLGFSSQSSLVCTCPSWMVPVKCLNLKFKTVPRPCPVDAGNPYCGLSCWQTIRDMDDNNMWDKEFTVQLCSTVNCFFSGTVGSTPWTADLHFSPTYEDDKCFWGPSVFDPCNPCLGFGTFTISVLSGRNISDCGGAGVVTASITDEMMLDLVTNCTAKKPTGVKLCNGCKDASNNPVTLIVADSLELSCCSPKNTGTCP